MGRNENIAIFKDTEKLCRTNRRIKESLENSIKLQKLILEGDKIKTPELTLYDTEARVLVSRKRT